MAAKPSLQTILDNAFVAPEVFKLRPDYRALLMIVDGITPGPSDAISEAFLTEAEALAKPVAEIPHVLAWREVYKAFGSKPAKFRNSLEALTRRVPSGGLPRVNRLTDIYNAISVKHQIPLGGEDLSKYDGPPRLTRATGKETFETTAAGETVVEHPDVGEVIWCDGAGVTCRRWNWRQCSRTALTKETTCALFIVDALEPCSDGVLTAAVDELESVLLKISPEANVLRKSFKAPLE